MKSTITTTLLVIIAIFIYFQYVSKPQVTQTAEMPTSLHPVVEEKMNQLIEQAAGKGISVVITDGFRSAEEQDRLYEKGRSSEGNIVTHARGGESYHNYGLAIDFAIKIPTGDILWDRQYDGNVNGVADWTEVVTIAKELGFEWGGDWINFKDYPHLEMDFGLAIDDLQRGERPSDVALQSEAN
ncbi:M15 family metallopeptidase [Bacillus marasmi]|uniref:M15 family metallopeptidase n=1 Tax=Bacillus marasmi TaxID=1926279 RepID=UPI0011C81DAF